MNTGSIFKKYWPHLAILVVFFIIAYLYFTPDFNGYDVRQHDIEQFSGMSNEIAMFREKYGEEPLWTNSMFGGMPAAQISVLHEGNIFQKGMIAFLNAVGVAPGIFLLHLIGFFLLGLCLRVRPWISAIGALAFAFASYEIVILQAGHNSKAIAVALMAPVVGAFILTYRNNWRWGLVLSALFMSFELAANHLQVTYYLGFLLLALGIYEIIRAFRQKNLGHFLKISVGLVLAYGLALVINYGNFSMTSDYARYTIRGENDVTITPSGDALAKSDGLSEDYITNWSYGIGESFTLISPYVKGSASVGIADSRFLESVENSDRTSEEMENALRAPFGMYWGEQPITSGPVYVGIVMFLLMILGLIYVPDRRKWALFTVGILALLLSWGHNFMGLTDFFIKHIPGYNKFRTVTIILVLIELIVPIIGILFLERLVANREAITQNKKPFFIAAASIFVLLVGMRVFGLGDGFSSARERQQVDNTAQMVMDQLYNMPPQQLLKQGIDINNQEQIAQIIQQQEEMARAQFSEFKKVRQEIFNSSVNRSLIFLVLGAGFLAIFFYTSLPSAVLMAGIAVLVMGDMIPVARNYLNSDENQKGEFKNWMEEDEKAYPFSPTTADRRILEMEMSDPRVKQAVEAGAKTGKQKAEQLGYSGIAKMRVIDDYRFSALNFATNYRVFTYNNPWGSSRASYFHKNLGGYHGAKLRNIQNIFDFHLSQSNNKVFDMLNVKYFIQGDQVRVNPTALGNAWFVQKLVPAKDGNAEIRGLGSEFEIENVGKGNLLVNGETVKQQLVYGSEDIRYLIPGQDTLKVQLQNGMQEGSQAFFVQDVNGNSGMVPAQTIASDTSASFSSMVSIRVKQTFEPAQEAIVPTSAVEKIGTKSFSGSGTIRMTSYKPNEIKYSIQCDSKQFAVFSEIYYPSGWKALVDDRETEIVKTDYLLRGLPVEAGTHEVVFRFDIPAYPTAKVMAIAGTILLILSIPVLLFWERKKKAE